MNHKLHYTRLRDYAVPMTDISLFPTQRIHAVKPIEPMGPLRLTPITPITPNVARAREQKEKKWVSTAVRVLLTLLLFALLFKSVSWSLVVQALVHAQYGMLLVSMIVGFCGIVLSAYQWRSLLAVEHISYDLADLISLYVVGIAFSHFLPTGMGGDAVKALRVGKKSGNSAGSTSAVLLCRIIGFFGMLLIALPTMLFWHERFDTKLVILFLLLTILVASMILGALLTVMFLPRFISGSRHRFLAPVLRVGSAVSKTMQRPQTLFGANLYGMAFWLVAVLNCYCYAQALHLDVPLYFYFFAVPLISLLSFLPISINGFGLRETAFVYAFSTVHVASEAALLLALLMDIQSLCFAVIGGVIYLTMGRKIGSTRERKAA